MGINDQEAKAPNKIVTEVRRSWGVVRLRFSSLVGCRGGIEIEGHNKINRKRVEYVVVRRVAKKNISTIKRFVGDERVISKIRSFEKNPAKNGAPHKAVFAINMQEVVIGSCWGVFPIRRRSWEWLAKWIIVPAEINKRALNNAWVNR